MKILSAKQHEMYMMFEVNVRSIASECKYPSREHAKIVIAHVTYTRDVLPYSPLARASEAGLYQFATNFWNI